MARKIIRNIKIEGQTEIFTAGEVLVNGDLCYLNSDGKMWKADASIETTTDTLLVICLESISAESTGEFLLQGRFTTTGLTVGNIYYVSTTPGEITSTAPSNSGEIVRIVGYALSTTVLYVNVDATYLEV